MFNKENFSKVLKKARGNRTNEDYYQDSGVSRSYISNYINCKREKAPSVEVINKLAESAHNNVTYNDLMIAAGYMENNVLNKNNKKNIYTGEELIKHIPKEYHEAFIKLDIKQIEFVKEMAEKDIDPDVLLETAKILADYKKKITKEK